jgi:hypothetical protein
LSDEKHDDGIGKEKDPPRVFTAEGLDTCLERTGLFFGITVLTISPNQNGYLLPFKMSFLGY